MKRLTWLFLAMIVVGIAIQACSDSKTYAEQLKDERNAINRYLTDNKIKVISVEEFEKDTFTSTVENEYVLFSSVGIYMQIVNRGSGDTLKNRDEVLVRFLEYDIMSGDTTGATNCYSDGSVDAFYYTHPNNSYYEYGAGQFVTENGVWESRLMGYYSANYNMALSQLASVPMGWLVPLKYIKHNAHVKVIVPSKQGHAYAMKAVYPYLYDLRSIKIR